MGLRPRRRAPRAVALHHSAPLRFAAGTLLAGGSVAALPRFAAGAALQALEQRRVRRPPFCAPAHLQRLFAALDEGAALPDLGSFRLLAHAGAPCPAPLEERTEAAFPDGTVWEFYGSTEGQFTACSPGRPPGPPRQRRPGPARARRLSVDPDGTIWCAVPEHARFSYWRDPDKTARTWRGDAFTVGDLGRLDDDGYLHLDGRREDLLLSGGVNVYPLEVEIALAGCPGVAEVAVFGRPDERWGSSGSAPRTSGRPPRTGSVPGRPSGSARPSGPRSTTGCRRCRPRSTGKVRRTSLAHDLGLPGD